MLAQQTERQIEMVLKIMSGDTQNYFEGQQIQVSLIDKVDSDLCKACDLDWYWKSVNDGLSKSHVAHIIGLEQNWAVMFDDLAFIMENGKTIDRIPHISEIC